MKRIFSIFSFLALFAVLFSIAFQSAHSVEHMIADASAEKCLHEKTESRHELTHKHHKEDNCFVCHFSFGSFVGSEILSFYHRKPEIHQEYSYFRSKEITSYFAGSLFAHRGPPVSI